MKRVVHLMNCGTKGTRIMLTDVKGVKIEEVCKHCIRLKKQSLEMLTIIAGTFK